MTYFGGFLYRTVLVLIEKYYFYVYESLNSGTDVSIGFRPPSLRSMAVLVGRTKYKGGRGQRNREEIGAGAIIFLTASPLVRGRFGRVFAASRLSRAPHNTTMLRRLPAAILVPLYKLNTQ